jgi:aminoglycoside phosphotransferase
MDYFRAIAILPRVLPADRAARRTKWRIQRIERPRWTPTGVTIVMVGPPEEPAAIVLKLPHTSEGVASLWRQREVQKILHDDPRLYEWRMVIPRPIAVGEIGGEFYFAEQALAGHSALSLLTDADHRARLQAAAAVAIGGLHRLTAATAVVDSEILSRWVDAPLSLIRSAAAHSSETARHGGAIERLRRELYETLEGRTLYLSWIHGDYWPGNLLLAADGATPLGIIDWDRAGAEELPGHDLLHLLLQTRKFLRGANVAEIETLLSGADPWTLEERAILDQARVAMPDDAIPGRVIGLLYWLRHTAGTLRLYPHNARNNEYLSNIERVLESV